MKEIRWHGRGGQGAFTAARLLGQALSIHENKYAQAFPTFGPERRGAPVLAFTRIDDDKITDRSQVETCDCVLVLDDTLWSDAVTNGLKENGVLIVNSTQDKEKFAGEKYQTVVFDATSLALQILGRPITNVPMLGALAAAAPEMVKIDSLEAAIDEQLSPKIREKNKKLLLKTYETVKEVL